MERVTHFASTREQEHGACGMTMSRMHLIGRVLGLTPAWIRFISRVRYVLHLLCSKSKAAAAMAALCDIHQISGRLGLFLPRPRTILFITQKGNNLPAKCKHKGTKIGH